MTSFGWKCKKPKLNNQQRTSAAFSENNQVDPGEVDDDIDWLNNMPIKKRKVPLEDAQSKAARLREEGILLASHERYREAISKWDEALQLTGNDEKILDMKAQAFIELEEFYPAVHSAELSVTSNPMWWESRQTLGRALLNLGELKAAKISFQKAIHLQPDNNELWEEDLNWTCRLWTDLAGGKNMAKDDLNFYTRECMRIGVKK